MRQFLITFILILSFLSFGCAYKLKQSEVSTNMQPVIITNFDGYAGGGRLLKQVFNKTPQKILAVSESVVDDLIFLGLQDKIVAISACYSKSYAPYEAEYAKFTRLTSGTGYPSKEAVLGLKPDLIVGWGSLFEETALGSVDYWQQKGIHTYVMTNTVPVKATGKRKVEYVINDLQQLARIFRIENQSQSKIMRLKKRIVSLTQRSEKIPYEKRPTVVTLQHLYGNEYFGRTASDLTANMIELACGVSLDDMIGGRKSVEYLVQLNPDMILLIDTETVPVESKIKALRKHKVLQKLAAVRNNKIFVIKHRAFYCGSLRSVEAVEELQKYIEGNFKLSK